MNKKLKTWYVGPEVWGKGHMFCYYFFMETRTYYIGFETNLTGQYKGAFIKCKISKKATGLTLMGKKLSAEFSKGLPHKMRSCIEDIFEGEWSVRGSSNL